MRLAKVVGTLMLLCAASDRLVCGESLEETANNIASATTVDRVKLSPQADWIAYHVTSGDISTNERTSGWRARWLKGSPEEVVVSDLGEGVAPFLEWRPGCPCVTQMRKSNATGHQEIIVRNLESGAFEAFDTGYATVDKIVWSSSGQLLAFSAQPSDTSGSGGLDPKAGVPYGTWVSGRDAPYGLFVLDPASGTVERSTPAELNVASGPGAGFTWSPDDTRIAVTIDRQSDSQGTDTDLLLVNRATKKVEALVKRPGMDMAPIWSHDGRKIAFLTQSASPDYLVRRAAIIDLSNHQIREDAYRTLLASELAEWSNDNQRVLFVSPIGMSLALASSSLSVHSSETRLEIPGEDTLDDHDSFSVSADGRTVAFLRSNVSTPPDVIIATMDASAKRVESVRQLTRFGAGFPLKDSVRVQLVSWPSTDGHFRIHGLLLALQSAWVGDRIREPLPTALYLTGGPSMVRLGFSEENDMRLALAIRGYAVLVPNTRGRAGYGEEFLKAVATDGSSLRTPYADALAGIDWAIREGIADPKRLAVLGHSYGARLTEYAITQTDRFKSAVVHEATEPDLMRYEYPFGAGMGSLFARDLIGVHDPTDDTERQALYADSPGLHAGKIHTPTLLLFGAKQNAELGGSPFFEILRKYGVPAAFFVYDEGHNFQRPAAVADSLVRTVEWTDYWVRGIDFPNGEHASQYKSFISQSFSPQR